MNVPLKTKPLCPQGCKQGVDHCTRKESKQLPVGKKDEKLFPLHSNLLTS